MSLVCLVFNFSLSCDCLVGRKGDDKLSSTKLRFVTNLTQSLNLLFSVAMIFAFVTYVRTVKLFRQEVNDLDYLIKLKTEKYS